MIIGQEDSCAHRCFPIHQADLLKHVALPCETNMLISTQDCTSIERWGRIRKNTGKWVRKTTEGAAREKYGRTFERDHEATLASDEPALDGISDQRGGAIHPKRAHHLVFVGLDSARGQLQDGGDLLHPPALGDE